MQIRRRFPLTCLALLCVDAARPAELHDVEFARPSGVSLTLDASIPKSSKPQPAVLLVHGGGWEAGDKRTYIKPWFTTLTEAGLAWFTINYRLAPQWKHPAAVEDIEAALAWIRSEAQRLGIDSKRIAIMGESAGGHLAALAAFRKDSGITALVSFYGVHDLPLWFEQRGEIPKNIAKYLPDTNAKTLVDISPTSFVKRDSPPMLLVHGTADKGVPHAQSARLCKLAEEAGVKCELFLIEGAPHGVENWEQEARFQVWKPKVVSWLRAALGLL